MTTKDIMSALDDIKDKLTDYEYLKFANLLKNKNDKIKQKYQITYIKQQPRIKLNGDIVFHQIFKTKNVYLTYNNYDDIINKLKRLNIIIINFIKKYNGYKYMNIIDHEYDGSFMFQEDDKKGDDKYIKHNENILISIKPIDDI